MPIICGQGGAPARHFYWKNRLKKKIRVLIVDDSALVREILGQILSSDPGIEVIGKAPDAFVAWDKIIQLRPDVVTLDVEMPGMDGVEFLRKLMPQYPVPVVMVSALTQKGKKITLDALDAGAVDFFTKPSSGVSQGLSAVTMELRTKIKIASTANVGHWKSKRYEQPVIAVPSSRALHETTDKVVAIGASTGGTEAIRKVVERFPVDMPGVVIVQHMPPGFTTLFAERLNNLILMEVREAKNGDRVMPGRVLLAPGGYHMTVKRSGGQYLVKVFQRERVNGHCPSVDVLMFSVAEEVGANAIGVILTGMGHDGADGMLAMRNAGAWNIAQDEATSVVFGMPKVAHEKGAVHNQAPLQNIAANVINRLAGPS